MGANPMQKKARNSFLLGVVITLIICLVIGGLFYFLIVSKNKQKEEERGAEIEIYVLNTDVKSGETITSDLLTPIMAYENMVPQNYIDSSSIEIMELKDKNGNYLYTASVESEEEKGKKENKLYINIEENTEYVPISSKAVDKNKVLIKKDTDGYYKTKKDGNNSKEYIDLMQVPVIAKIDMYKNSVVTNNSVVRGEVTTDDLRYVEYNMLVLPTTVDIGSYIDVRLTLPSGQDLIVISHKEIKTLFGDTIGIELTEEEILLMENAIVEAYIMPDSKLYVIQYVEPGMQTAAIPTYVQNSAVHQLILENDNIVGEAKEKLEERYKRGQDGYLIPEGEVRGWVNNEVNKYSAESQENIEAGLKEEIENAKAAREAYLSGLTSY